MISISLNANITFSVTEFYVEGVSKMASPNVNKVINAYVHAVTARCPRNRYSVGWDAKFLMLPLSYAPSMLQDIFTLRAFHKCVPVALEEGADVPIPGSMKAFGSISKSEESDKTK